MHQKIGHNPINRQFQSQKKWTLPFLFCPVWIRKAILKQNSEFSEKVLHLKNRLKCSEKLRFTWNFTKNSVREKRGKSKVSENKGIRLKYNMLGDGRNMKGINPLSTSVDNLLQASYNVILLSSFFSTWSSSISSTYLTLTTCFPLILLLQTRLPASGKKVKIDGVEGISNFDSTLSTHRHRLY